MATKVKKKVPKVPKYADGFFVDNKSNISNGLGMASGLLGSMNDNPYKVNTGAAVGSGALSGAATGMQVAGPWGAAAGAVIGAGVGLVGANKKQRQIDQFDREFNANGLANIDHTINHNNVNPYGTQMYKDGGSIHINPANKGKFTATKKRTGKSTEELTHSSNPLTRKRAIFAQNAKKWNHHADGDTVIPTPNPGDPKLSPRDYLTLYSNSPVYQQRLQQTGGNTHPEDVGNIYNTKITYNPNQATEAFPRRTYNPRGINKINFNQNQIKQIGANNDEAQAHEWSHIIRPLSGQEQYNIFSSNKDPFIQPFLQHHIFDPSSIKNWTQSINDNGNDKHDLRPDENKADLDALRYMMYKKGIYDTSKGNLDEKTLNKALADPEIKNSFTTKRLLKMFDPKSLVQMNNTIAAIPDENPVQYYADGGGIYIQPSHRGRFTNWAESHHMGVQEAASHVMANKDNYSSSVVKMANFAKNAAGWKHEDGDYVLDGNPSNSPTPEVTNTQQNMINIQKGELLIHPETGKILQDYTGVNPLTGGRFENHAKGKQEESPNNFTLADPGLFVVTKKTSKQYKDAIDRNDKMAQKTVLMNIRNAKIAKEGGLQKNYADGDTVIPYLNVPGFNPPTNTNPAVSTMLPYRIYNPIQNPDKPITSISNTAIQAPAQITQSVQPVDKVSSYVRPTQPNTGFNVNGLLDGLTQYGPSLVNLAQGTFGNTPLQSYARPATNPYANQIIANMPKDVDMSPIISDINATSNLANTDLLNNTNNSAVYRANRQQLATNTNRALTNARMQAQQENNRVAAERANIYGSLGEQSVQDQTRRREYDLSVDDINARRQAAKQNLFNAGLSQLQQTTQNNSYNAKKQAMDKYTIDLMSQIFPNLRYYNQFNSDNINKLLTR